jgi:multiple sugar transport system substrate-binding protein
VNLTPSTDTDFIRGKEALSWIGYWMKPQYQQALGDNLVLLPMPDFGHGPKTGMGTWNWGITSSCKNPDAAWEILQFLLEPDQILFMTNANGAVPARKSALARSELYRPGGLLHLYIEQNEAGFTVPRPITPAYPTITKAFAQAFKNIADGADVKSELDKAVLVIDQDIKDHNGYSVRN